MSNRGSSSTTAAKLGGKRGRTENEDEEMSEEESAGKPDKLDLLLHEFRAMRTDIRKSLDEHKEILDQHTITLTEHTTELTSLRNEVNILKTSGPSPHLQQPQASTTYLPPQPRPKHAPYSGKEKGSATDVPPGLSANAEEYDAAWPPIQGAAGVPAYHRKTTPVTAHLPYPDADCLILGGFPRDTPKADREAKVKELLEKWIPQTASYFQQPVYSRYLYSTMIHIRHLPTAPALVLKQAEVEYKNAAEPMYYKIDNKTYKLWASPARDPHRRKRNLVLKAVHEWAKANGKADAELDFGGAILMNKRPVVRVHNDATWTRIVPDFCTDDDIYTAIKAYEEGMREGKYCPQPISTDTVHAPPAQTAAPTA